MKLGLSPLAFVSILALEGCTASTAHAPVEVSQCRVLISVEEGDGPRTHVDLSAGSCDKKQVIVIGSRDHAPGGYFLALTVGGTTSARVVSSEVARFRADESSDDMSAVLLRNLPPFPPRSESPPAQHQRPIATGAWSEIASGAWADTTPYRVLVRIDQT